MTSDKDFLDNENEDCILKNKEGDLLYKFKNSAEKIEFIRKMERLEEVREEGYHCGHCAAFPCFRKLGENEPAGHCFQSLRRCRQECEFYASIEDSPGERRCKKDGSQVQYEQLCHIPEMRSKIKPNPAV